MRGNLKSAQIRLLSLLLLFLITASGVFAYSAAKSYPAKLAISVETALKAIDFAAENDISIDSEFSANLRQSINFNRNRYYSPALGRFVSKDPIGFAADVNLYRYADNNPIKYTDPTGLFVAETLSVLTVKEILIGTGLFGGAVYFNTPEGKETLTDFFQKLQSGASWTKEKIQDAYQSITCQFLPDDAAQRIFLNSQEDAADETPQDEDAPDFVVDEKGNVIPLKPGEKLQGSPDGRWIQIIGPNGKPTGVRIDQGHKPGGAHTDPRSLEPHGHIPGVNNPDGTPWLPIKW